MGAFLKLFMLGKAVVQDLVQDHLDEFSLYATENRPNMRIYMHNIGGNMQKNLKNINNILFKNFGFKTFYILIIIILNYLPVSI